METNHVKSADNAELPSKHNIDEVNSHKIPTVTDFNTPTHTANMPRPTESMQFGANNFAPAASKLGFLGKLFSRTRAYIPEYAVLLIVTGTLIGIVNGLFSSSIDYIAEPKPHPTWGGGWQYTASLGILATALVLIPALVILTRRIKGTESEATDIKNTGWRKAFLGIFLVLITLTALGYGIALVYQIISQIAGAGLVSANKAVWKTYLKDIFAVLLFGLTTWLYTHDYRFMSTDSGKRHLMLAKFHRYGLTILAVVLSILFCTTALKVQRDDFIDNMISEDISTIHNKISDFESSKRKELKQLSDLKLSDEVKGRITKYKYEYTRSGTSGYKLCAVFKTDTSTRKDKNNDNTALEQSLSESSSYYNYPTTTPDPAVHDKGRICFTYKSNITNQYNNRYIDDSTDVYDNSEYN